MPDQIPGRDHTAAPVSELLTIGEAAQLLRAPVATLRYWRHLGQGDCKVGIVGLTCLNAVVIMRRAGAGR
jgi:hypothetical protein